MSNYYYTVDGRRIKVNLETFTSVVSESVQNMGAKMESISEKTMGPKMESENIVGPKMESETIMGPKMESENTVGPKMESRSENNTKIQNDRKESLKLKGDLSLDGIIRARKYLMEDGSDMKTILSEKKVLILPESISFDAQGNMNVGSTQNNINLNIEGQLCIGKTCIDSSTLVKLIKLAK
jgi:hypothetical protein